MTTGKGGRPPAIQADAKTLKVIRGLGEIQATTRECAAVMGVSHQTLIATFQRLPELARAYEAGKEEGKVSLRRTQFRLAQTNAAMAIFLGKNILDQTDKQDITANVTQDVNVTDARSKLEHLISLHAESGVEGGSTRKPN